MTRSSTLYSKMTIVPFLFGILLSQAGCTENSSSSSSCRPQTSSLQYPLESGLNPLNGASPLRHDTSASQRSSKTSGQDPENLESPSTLQQNFQTKSRVAQNSGNQSNLGPLKANHSPTRPRARLRAEKPDDLTTARKNLQIDIDALVKELNRRYEYINSHYQDPSERDTAYNLLLGLDNLGATCYQNAANKLIWAFGSTTWVSESETQNATHTAIDEIDLDQILRNTNQANSFNNRGMRQNSSSIFESLGDLIEFDSNETQLAQSSRNNQENQPLTVNRSLDQNPRHASTSYQQDAGEYLKKVFEAIQPEKIFGGFEIATQIRFMDGSKKPLKYEPSAEGSGPNLSRKVENFFQLPVPDSKNSTLQDALDTFLADENLTGADQVQRDTSEEKADAIKGTYLVQSSDRKLPRKLIFSLNRFLYNAATGSARKQNNPVEIPKQIHVPFFTESEDQPNTLLRNNLILELKAVILHYGDVGGGHYKAYVSQQVEGSSQRDWYLHDDSRSIQCFTEESALKEIKQKGYIFLFETAQRNHLPNEPSGLSSPTPRCIANPDDDPTDGSDTDTDADPTATPSSFRSLSPAPTSEASSGYESLEDSTSEPQNLKEVMPESSTTLIPKPLPKKHPSSYLFLKSLLLRNPYGSTVNLRKVQGHDWPPISIRPSNPLRMARNLPHSDELSIPVQKELK